MAVNYTLTRQTFSDDGILGEITDENSEHICYTCERPYLDNEPDISSIPTGTYNACPFSSVSHPDVWELVNVPGRTGILIHNGNTENDSEGCIVVGSETGILNGFPAVLNSDATLASLQNILPPYFTLTIVNFNPFMF